MYLYMVYNSVKRKNNDCEWIRFTRCIFFSSFIFRYVCEEHWPMPLYNYYYSFALLVLQFVLPLLVLIFTYTRIAFAVWGKKPPGEAENSRDQRMAKSKRKVINHIRSNIYDLCDSWSSQGFKSYVTLQIIFAAVIRNRSGKQLRRIFKRNRSNRVSFFYPRRYIHLKKNHASRFTDNLSVTSLWTSFGH